ncbi:hypothetical protein [Bacillus cereus group sp. BfR-BA-01524]|uniref:hypothetical protein n=1 Tax=Bacillus cereus group sp. BfR-BA-01524 TaxID=2920372 RepID=UPI001F5AFFCF
MDSLTIQSNTYELNIIRQIERKKPTDRTFTDVDLYKRFGNDIYTTYKQIRHICNPRACEKTSLQTVKNSLREHWLEQYLNLTLQEANLIIEYADKFFGLAIK